MKQRKLLLILLTVPMALTYGGIYSWAQHWSGGWLSHEHNTTDHLRALNWAIFPPMWILAPIITNGYEDGLQFRHHHARFCRTVDDFLNQENNHCELDPECDPVYRKSPCPDRERGGRLNKK
jgi:hypothetical protein